MGSVNLPVPYCRWILLQHQRTNQEVFVVYPLFICFFILTNAIQNYKLVVLQRVVKHTHQNNAMYIYIYIYTYHIPMDPKKIL